MKTKGRRQSKNVIFRDQPEQFIHLPGVTKSVDDDLGGFGPRLGAEGRLRLNALFSEHLRNPIAMALQSLTADDINSQRYYNKPENELWVRKRQETAKPTKFRRKPDV